MQKILLILSLLMLQNVFAQTANDSIFQKKWIDNLLDDENISTKEFSSFRYVDYTDLIKTNVSDLPLGYIGENFERFQIIFTSVTKEEFGNETYFNKGKSMVKNNVCDFIGNITITHKSYYKNAKLLSNLYADTVKVGLFTGTYRFTEKEDTRPHSGIFSGNFAIRFYICGHSACLDDLTIIDVNYSFFTTIIISVIVNISLYNFCQIKISFFC